VSASSATQLDLFLDSRAVVLANELKDAVLARDSARAMSCLAALEQEAPEHPARASLAALARFLRSLKPPEPDHTAVTRTVEQLEAEVAPAARLALGVEAGEFLKSFYRDLAAALRELSYDPAQPNAHRSLLLQRCGDFAESEAAALTIANWRRTPEVLGWVTVARYRLRGLGAARPTLFALAWHGPQSLAPLVMELGDEALERDFHAFESACDWTGIPEAALPAWFPAWYLVEHPASAEDLDLTVAPKGPAASAAALLVQILDLERRGSSRALVDLRARLRALNSELFDLYMARRRVFHG
jgi:hypothetical protein